MKELMKLRKKKVKGYTYRLRRCGVNFQASSMVSMWLNVSVLKHTKIQNLKKNSLQYIVNYIISMYM